MRKFTCSIFIVLSAGLLCLGGCTASTTNDSNSAGSVPSGTSAPAPTAGEPTPATPVTPEEPIEQKAPTTPEAQPVPSQPSAGTQDSKTPEAGQKPPAGKTPAGGKSVAEGRPGQGEPCPDNVCAEGLTCLSYYGFAGPRGPKFTSCEIPCVKGGCPSGQTCTTIADGPGEVCRSQR